MYQKLSAFHLTHPTLIISYLHVIALIICNFLYPLGFIDSFYVLFFIFVLSLFLFHSFFLFYFPAFSLDSFLSFLSFIFSFPTFILIFYILAYYYLLFFLFLFFLIFLFSYSLLRWECLSYYHTRIPFSFFILISCLFSFFLFFVCFQLFISLILFILSVQFQLCIQIHSVYRLTDWLEHQTICLFYIMRELRSINYVEIVTCITDSMKANEKELWKKTWRWNWCKRKQIIWMSGFLNREKKRDKK